MQLSKAEKYYRTGKGPANRLIKSKLRHSDLVVHGGKAINAQLPSWLSKATEDWDILSVNPEETARKLEGLLDERYGGDYFEVIPAKHEGTFRIINKVTRREVADITLPERRIGYRTINGINYATLEYHVKRIKEILRDPEVKFRHAKDRETLQRIKIHRRKYPRRVEAASSGVIMPIRRKNEQTNR